MHIVAVANQKGGVGKTTTSVNLAASLESLGKKTLLIDLDPQGNATMGSGVDKHAATINSYHWLVESARFDEVRRDSSAEYSIIPSNTDLTAAEMDLLRSERRNFRLKEKLEAINSFEYIIIDCPPSLNVLTLNALFTSGSVLIPVQCEYYALEGLSALLETVDGVRNNGNSDLGLEGILRTMFDTRISLTREASRQLIQHFRDKVYRTVIPRNVRLAEAPSHGVPAMLYDRTSRGAVAYQALAAEMLRNHMETPEEEMVCE